jgi:hypothetical protein
MTVGPSEHAGGIRSQRHNALIRRLPLMLSFAALRLVFRAPPFNFV